jgi:hypothetical protein
MMFGCSLEGLVGLLLYVDQKCGSAELLRATMEGLLVQLECLVARLDRVLVVC